MNLVDSKTDYESEFSVSVPFVFCHNKYYYYYYKKYRHKNDIVLV